MLHHVWYRCGAQQSADLGSSGEALDGILGFGQSNSSMLSQLASSGKVKKVFSHCLDTTNGGGIFAIGRVVEPKVKTTPLVPDQYVTLGLISAELLKQLLISYAIFCFSFYWWPDINLACSSLSFAGPHFLVAFNAFPRKSISCHNMICLKYVYVLYPFFLPKKDPQSFSLNWITMQG